MTAVAAIGSCLFFGTGCPEQTGETQSDALASREPSPNASIQPAPLEQTEALFPPQIDDAGLPDAAATASDAEAPPLTLREDLAVPADILEGREIFGNELEGVFVWHDVPASPVAPDLDTVALGVLREKTALTLGVHATTGDRAKFVLSSPVFPLSQGTELRARRDRYGHLLLWPHGGSYRPIPPGALRALLGERRADVVSLVPGTSESKSRGKVLGFSTTVTTVSSPFGTLELEQAEISGLTRSGVLLCRFLVELNGVEPSTSACDDGRTPLRADYRWRDGGKLSFVVRKLGRRRPFEAKEIAAPPLDAQFTPGLLPPAPKQRVSAEDLSRMRRQAAAQGQGGDRTGNVVGLVARNHTPALVALLVNTIPVTWISPGEEQRIDGLKRGRYAVAFHDFLGQVSTPARPVEVPGQISVGDAPEVTPPDQ